MRLTRAGVGGLRLLATRRAGVLARFGLTRPTVPAGGGRHCAHRYPRPVPEVSEQETDVDGLITFWRSAPTANPVPALYVHGVPTNSDDWVAFLQRTGGIAPDLPGFGRSGKTGSRSYTMAEYDTFIERFLDVLGEQQVDLVVHDWGAVALAFAQRFPERIRRLVIINAVPLLDGYRWHRTARMWRTPGVGELLMGTTNRFSLRLLSREANATPGPMPDEWIETVISHLDQGTQRAILRLYRSSPPEALAAAGSRLGDLRMPALVIWGTRDPYIPPEFGARYAKVLAQAELLELPDAGHWGWLDRPDMVERVAEFLAGG
jgi:pimeloyl-ACP methyl ester carboxylesterase